jgi:hypothetical protein
MAEPFVSFVGEVTCARTDAAPGLTLSGRDRAHPGAHTTLAFSGTAPADLPATLADVRIERLPAGWRIASGTRAWQIAAVAVHLHRDAGTEFYRAIPPRPAPWRKRLFWRLVLGIARLPAGLNLLRALRG